MLCGIACPDEQQIKSIGSQMDIYQYRSMWISRFPKILSVIDNNKLLTAMYVCFFYFWLKGWQFAHNGNITIFALLSIVYKRSCNFW